MYKEGSYIIDMTMAQLPENVQLLSSTELKDLTENHTHELSHYLSKYHSVDEKVSSTLNYRQQLLDLEEEFKKLDNDRIDLNKELEELRIINMQYVTKWKDSESLYKEKYSENAYQVRLKDNIQNCLAETVSIETELFATSNIDTRKLDMTLNEYCKKKAQYYVMKERLATWDAQGILRK